MWDEKNNVFFQRREADIEAALEKCKSWKPCASCGRDKLRSEQESWSVTPTGTLRQGDTKYHKQDFVYIRPEELQHRLYIIGQIERIKCYPSDDGEEMLTVDVRVYKRLDVLIREEYLDDFGAHKSDEVRFVTVRNNTQLMVWVMLSVICIKPTRSSTECTLIASKGKCLLYIQARWLRTS